MLTHLTIRNFAVVKHIELDLTAGLTAITGETGAGKSIGIDALVLCTGGRADASMVRSGATKAEIIAHFNIQQNKRAQQWLDEYELDSDGECFIRRVISAEGRSKAFINGSPVALQQLKQLGAILLNIHGQNDHQQLLKETMQRNMLDSFAKHTALVEAVNNSYTEFQHAKRHYEKLRQSAQAREDRKHLLSYQVSELDEFGLEEQEFTDLEVEHKRLSNSQSLLEQSQLSFHRLYDDEQFNAMSAIQQSIDNLSGLCDSDPQLQPIVNLLSEAAIQVEEAAQELRGYCDELDIDPMRMQQVEQRYDKVNELARKHQVMPEVLFAHHMSLIEELNGIEAANDELENIQSELEQLESRYLANADKLSASRQKAAKSLAKKLEQKIQRMNMPHATIEYRVHADQSKANAHGIDTVSILISTNLGQPADSLDKVVSGGELARVGLAMQVLTADQSMPPTMIFDEVDTGISGPTASIVGQLLRQMGEQAQVMCVTHLPQVAAQAHNQLFVTKKIVEKSTETHIVHLENEQRVNELARLLAGDSITDSAISNARSLLMNVA
ncbi:DNA repair protein RecN [Alteromonas sp. ASW11-36]|uniref:DNA repair protein RecN n=1 Tax=Alteromonas arenosi TaxID=3055817 RepID=A0ABT7SUI0_9ALTE|nr:DNA repair protein RecN [Alteromonas sp. ASW11-36]MDM7859855.1 DNA repair protein RecN [Alteromonas sp. ASW11-36]